MKQIISYLSITCGIFLFAACHPYVEYVKVRTYKAKDYITKELEVYEPRELLYPILDSIIIKTRECPEYEKTKDCLAFDFSIREEAPYDLENRKGYHYLSISVIYYVPRLTCHHWTKAVFYYKGCSFYVIDTLADLFLQKTDRKVSISYIDPNKYQFEVFQRGDQDMFWSYLYKDEALQNICYGRCPVQFNEH